MTETTKNLELIKESEEEFYNVETVNGNWDKVDAGFDKIKHCHVLRIPGTYNNEIRYVGFASLPVPSSGGRAEVTFLVSGVGNIASPSCGTYLIQCGTRDHTSMAVTELTPPGSDGDITFGYWLAGDRVIFGMKRGPYNYHTNIAMISEDVNGEGFQKYEIAELYNAAAKPSGWTAAGKRKFLISDGNAVSATKLNAKRSIDGVNFDGTASVSHYGVCPAASSVVAKTVSISGFTKVVGASVSVRFTNGNTAEHPTLNVQNTGAYPIYYMGNPVLPGYISPDSIVPLVFDGQNRWVIVGDFLQQQMDALKKFVHYQEYGWEKIDQKNYNIFNGFLYGNYGPDIIHLAESSEPYAKCALIDLHNIEAQRYKIVSHYTNNTPILNDNPGIAVKGIILGPDRNMSCMLNAVQSTDFNKIDNSYIYNVSRTDVFMAVNSWGSPLDIEIYKEVVIKTW